MTNSDPNDLVRALTAALHALRSYQFGNASPDLAKEVADFCETALAGAPAPEGALFFPHQLTDPMRQALGTMVFECGPLAHMFRDAGHVIHTKAEAEQAFILHWFATLVLQHGDRWRWHASERIEALVEVVKAGGRDPMLPPKDSAA